jgi:hypothetical protein
VCFGFFFCKKTARFNFGDFSISGNPDRFKRIVASLAAEVRVHRGGAGATCFVDTKEVKADMVQWLVDVFAVDVVVDFGSAEERGPCTCTTVKGPSMPDARMRTSADRRRERSLGLGTFFGAHTEVEVPFAKAELIRADGLAITRTDLDGLQHQVAGVSCATGPATMTLAWILDVDFVNRKLVLALPCGVSSPLPNPCRLTFHRMYHPR